MITVLGHRAAEVIPVKKIRQRTFRRSRAAPVQTKRKQQANGPRNPGLDSAKVKDVTGDGPLRSETFIYIYISYIQILLGLDFVSPGDPGLTEEEVKILLQGAAMGDAESQVLIGRMALEGPARGEGHGYGEKGSDDPKKSQDIPR